MHRFSSLGILTLAYCLSSTFISFAIIDFGALKIISFLFVIMIAHKLRFKELFYINLIDLALFLLSNYQNLIAYWQNTEPLFTFLGIGSFPPLWFTIPCLTTLIVIGSALDVAIFKFVNRLLPKRLKLQEIGY